AGGCLLLCIGAWRWLASPAAQRAPAAGDPSDAPLSADSDGSGREAVNANASVARAPIGSAATLALASDPEREVRGLVMATAGAPIAGASVRALFPLDRQVPGIGASADVLAREVGHALTDDAGAFRMRLDVRQTYDLAIDAAGFAWTRAPNH